jgi:hypothetical protein
MAHVGSNHSAPLALPQPQLWEAPRDVACARRSRCDGGRRETRAGRCRPRVLRSRSRAFGASRANGHHHWSAGLWAHGTSRCDGHVADELAVSAPDRDQTRGRHLHRAPSPPQLVRLATRRWGASGDRPIDVERSVVARSWRSISGRRARPPKETRLGAGRHRTGRRKHLLLLHLD